MEKSDVINLLSHEGYKIKASQITEIRKLGTLRARNSANTELSDYTIETTKGSFIISEELVPNRFGSTAFSTDKKLKLTGIMASKTSFEDEDEEEKDDDGNSGKEVTSEEL